MDPLAQLSDIHLPTNVHSYPIAPGWWILAVIVLTLIIYSALKLRHYFIKRKAQKLALKKLSTISQVSATVTLLKWAALQYFPRTQVANLTGDAFKDFLISTLPIKHQQKFVELSEQYFISVYQRDTTSKTSVEFSSAAKLWLSHALPPKKVSSALMTADNLVVDGLEKTSKKLTDTSAESSSNTDTNTNTDTDTERNGVKA